MSGVVWQLYVVVFIVKSESERLPGTNLAEEDMKENVQAMFICIAANVRILNRIE